MAPVDATNEGSGAQCVRRTQLRDQVAFLRCWRVMRVPRGKIPRDHRPCLGEQGDVVCRVRIDLGLCVRVVLQIFGCVAFFASIHHHRHAIAHQRIVDAGVRIGCRPRREREQADQQQVEESRKHGLETNNLDRPSASGATHQCGDKSPRGNSGSGHSMVELGGTGLSGSVIVVITLRLVQTSDTF